MPVLMVQKRTPDTVISQRQELPEGGEPQAKSEVQTGAAGVVVVGKVVVGEVVEGDVVVGEVVVTTFVGVFSTGRQAGQRPSSRAGPLTSEKWE